MLRLTAAMLLAAALALAGCPRVLEPDDPRMQAQVTGAHPWDNPNYRGPEVAIREQLAAQTSPDQSTAVERPAQRGPSLADEDTLEVEAIEGSWLVTCITADEKLGLLPTSEQDVFNFAPGGILRSQSYTNWQAQTLEGRWSKARAGVLSLDFGQGPTDFFAQLHRGEFLYLWNYDRKSGFWMARLSESASERIEANRFETTRGTLILNDIVATSCSGRVEGRTPMTVSGFYNRGILSLRWEMDDRSSAGYAMFRVPADWASLSGVWWVDDYEAAPFSGDWNGTRQ